MILKYGITFLLGCFLTSAVYLFFIPREIHKTETTNQISFGKVKTKKWNDDNRPSIDNTDKN